MRGKGFADVLSVRNVSAEPPGGGGWGGHCPGHTIVFHTLCILWRIHMTVSAVNTHPICKKKKEDLKIQKQQADETRTE